MTPPRPDGKIPQSPIPEKAPQRPFEVSNPPQSAQSSEPVHGPSLDGKDIQRIIRESGKSRSNGGHLKQLQDGSLLEKLGEMLGAPVTSNWGEALEAILVPAPLLVQMSPPSSSARLAGAFGQAASALLLAGAVFAVGKVAGKAGSKAAEAAAEKAVAEKRPSHDSFFQELLDELLAGFRGVKEYFGF